MDLAHTPAIPKTTSHLRWLVFILTWHKSGHLERGNFNWENAFIRLACLKASQCSIFLISGWWGGRSLLWVAPPQAGGPGLYEKVSRASNGKNPGRYVPPRSLLQFLPWPPWWTVTCKTSPKPFPPPVTFGCDAQHSNRNPGQDRKLTDWEWSGFLWEELSGEEKNKAIIMSINGFLHSLKSF